MIVDAIIGLLLGTLTFVLDLLPSFTPPALEYASTASCEVQAVCHTLEGVRSWDYWLNFEVIAVAIDLGTSTLVVAVGIKVALWLYEKLPFKFS